MAVMKFAGSRLRQAAGGCLAVAGCTDAHAAKPAVCRFALNKSVKAYGSNGRIADVLASELDDILVSVR
jgi:hypothetical protein